MGCDHPTRHAQHGSSLRTNPCKHVAGPRHARWMFRSPRVGLRSPITLLIIGTLLLGAWDFVSKLADTEDGLGRSSTSGGSPSRPLRHRHARRRHAHRHGIAMLVAVPLGLGAAIYLSEYAGPAFVAGREADPRVLAGIPSVVLDFAIAVHQPEDRQPLFDSADKAFTLMAAGIAVGILTIPIIASVAEDALRAVPMALREASFGLGAQRSQTTFRVVLPAAISASSPR